MFKCFPGFIFQFRHIVWDMAMFHLVIITKTFDFFWFLRFSLYCYDHCDPFHFFEETNLLFGWSVPSCNPWLPNKTKSKLLYFFHIISSSSHLLFQQQFNFLLIRLILLSWHQTNSLFFFWFFFHFHFWFFILISYSFLLCKPNKPIPFAFTMAFRYQIIIICKLMN